jgi:hypothetical protein
MLRPPAEVVGSKQTYYQNRLGSAHLAASWLNMLLHTERGTRAEPGSPGSGGRVFVRYEDLLEDWTRVTMDIGDRLQLQNVIHADSEQVRDGHRFVDPTLRRMNLTLEDLGLPRKLHELTAETWSELNKLADPGGDTPEAHATLDQLREAYVDLYAEAEAISRSSVVATEQRLRRKLPQQGGPQRPAAAPGKHGADRIPHGVRAMVPPKVRTGLRKLAGRPR